MKRAAALFATLGLALTPALEGCAPGGTSEAEAQAEAQGGQELYRAHCEVCHGSEGDGDGPAAYLLFPKPRDFTRAYFKIRSTRSGSLPTDEDLFETITRGMPGSAMPSFEWLSETERLGLVEVVKSFSEDFATLQPDLLPPAPEPLQAGETGLAVGAESYRELGCGKCHGEQGRGDGPSAAELEDDWDDPIRPNDFTRGIYKGGGTEHDIYLRFASGMDGTPMPSFEGTATPEEIWALVSYVKSLAGEKVAVQPSTGRIIARRIASPAPTEPSDPRWREGEEFRVPLMLLWQRQQAVDVLRVRALHDGEGLSILLSWDDATAAWSALRGEDFADGVAVQFSLTNPRPHFSMGSDDGPVNLWHWRADRQLDLAERRRLTSVYPAAALDTHLDALNFVTAVDAGNLAAAPDLVSPVQDLNAEGFGSITEQPGPAQNVNGSGIWESGEWRVLMWRSLSSRDRGDVSMSVGEVLPIAFAVWDGDRADRDGQKAVSTWYELQVDR